MSSPRRGPWAAGEGDVAQELEWPWDIQEVAEKRGDRLQSLRRLGRGPRVPDGSRNTREDPPPTPPWASGRRERWALSGAAHRHGR